MEIHCAHDELQDLDLLQPNPKNPNNHPKDQIKRLAKIMKHQGWRSPIVVSKRSGFITKGHGRLEAARLNKWVKAPIDLQDYKNEADEYADMVADNKIAELSETDLSMVLKDVLDLGPDFDFDLLGIPDFKLPEDFEPQCDEDDIPEHVEPKTKLGDLYLLGEHRLLCGDSTNIQHVDKLMDGEKAEMSFTDPPYGVDYSGGIQFTGSGVKKDQRERLKNDHSADIYSESLPILAVSVDGPIYTWYAASLGKQLYNCIDSLGEYHAMIVWVKNGGYGALNACYKQKHEPCVFWKPKGSTLRWDGPTTENTIWEMKKDGHNKLHPTQKPVELAERAISNHKAKTVLDLFGGSGSTLIACEKTKRKCFMMELDPHYCDVIVARWEKYTGKKAELIEDRS